MDAVEFCCEDAEGVVCAVADKEGEIDELVGVGELTDEVEMLEDMMRSVAQRCEDEDALIIR